MKFKIGIVLAFLGSVFFASEKFVNETGTVKVFFTVLAFLVCSIIILWKKKTLRSLFRQHQLSSVFKGCYVVGVLQAIYGLLQKFGVLSSHSSSFPVTGSFDNPAGFAIMLSLLFPIGVYWFIHTRKAWRWILLGSLGCVWLVISLSGSRTGIYSLLIGGLAVLFIENPTFGQIKSKYAIKQISVCVVFIMLVVLLALYHWRKESANGRLFIWKVSTEMVMEKPLFGYGHKGFQAHYMDYQARYFIEHPHSKYCQLADNVKHPFNEFVKIAVNYGLVGLLLCVALLCFVLWKMLNTKHPYRSVFIGAYLALLVSFCFSYPLQYAPVWLLMGFYMLGLFSEHLPNKPLSWFPKIILSSICVAGIMFFTFRMQNEIKWKSIATNSLKGQTIKMLPQYEELYAKMSYNAFFLYNYGAELNYARHYDKSIDILQECQEKFDDYDLQMLQADNYLHIGDTIKSIETYQYASEMIPCRFLPLYHQLEIYKMQDNTSLAKQIAKDILDKDVKIPSRKVRAIKAKARAYLREE